LIKPAVFLAALEDSSTYNLMTGLDDSAVRIENKDGTVWSPANFDGVHHKTVPLYKALSRSYNAACVRLGMELGLDRLEGVLGRLGVGGKMDFYPSSFLGTVAMSPMEVAGMYRTLATGGIVLPIRCIRETGPAATGRPRPGVRNFDPVPVYLLNMALKMVISEGTARSDANQVIRDLSAAGKTGTTDGLRDSWFAGFTGDLLVVVWVGKDDGTPCKLTGADGAFYIWQKIVAKVSKKAFTPGPPESVIWIQVDPNTGRQVLEPNCPWAVALPFPAGAEPTEVASCRDVMLEETDQSWLRTLF
jgi:penicillin-binding protein 1B